VTSLADCAGTWLGSNGFRLMPTDEFAERPAGATLALAAGGHLTSLAYTWEHPDDGPQEGLLVFGPGEDAGSVVALWGDSWHQQPAPRAFAGSGDDEAVELEADYGGGWLWRIALSAPGPSALTLRMDNVVPAEHRPEDAGPYTAMLMELRPG
jgi:hypothetical protein